VVLEACLQDNQRAMLLQADGDYEPVTPSGEDAATVEAQLALMGAQPPLAEQDDSRDGAPGAARRRLTSSAR
jgi:hypothetical protein